MNAFGRRLGPLSTGIAIVVLYGLAVVASRSLGTGVRPLFEGIGPPPPYRWVRPPADFAAGNVPPRSNETDVNLAPDGSVQAGAVSEDNQVVLNLAARAIPPHPPDTAARVRIVPLDPATLGPLPPGLRPDGNAYEVRLGYQPSGAEVPPLASAGNILLTVPEPTAGLFFSADGQSWQQLGGLSVPGQPLVGGAFERPGFYLGAAHITARRAGEKTIGTARVLVAAVLTVALALVLGLAPYLLRRIRRTR